MRWILFILFCLLGAPAHAVSIPGVTTTTTTDSTTEPAPEPDIEQKKAAYGALADVLDNQVDVTPDEDAVMQKISGGVSIAGINDIISCDDFYRFQQRGM
ncbi:hypothetical protein ACUOA9_20070, partial [Escherichia sp. HC-TM1]